MQKPTHFFFFCLMAAARMGTLFGFEIHVPNGFSLELSRPLLKLTQ